MKRIVFAFVTALIALPALCAAAPRVLSLHQVHRIGQAPRIDGELGDECWDELLKQTGFYEFGTKTPRPAAVRTAWRAGFDGKGLYLAVRNYEEHPEEIRAKVTRRDGANLWRDDSVELYFSPGPEVPQTYRKLVINAAGTQWDQVWKGRGKADTGWDADGWTSGVSRDQTGWTIEMHVPWSDLGATPREGDLWRFALIRYSYTEGKRFAASAFRAQFDAPEAFGYLYFGDLRPEDGPAIRQLADKIPGEWYLPVDRRCLVQEGRELKITTRNDVLTTQKTDIATRLQQARGVLTDDHPVLQRAANRYAGQIEAVPASAETVPAFMQRLAQLHAIREKLPDLDPSVEIAGPVRNAKKGVDVFTVRSPYLGGANKVEVLLPDDFAPQKRYRVLYVLPVNAGIGGRWGDCLQQVKKTGLHNEHDLICVTMAFDTTPWYGAHATDPSIRHEAYIKEVVVPLVEKHYPAGKSAENRLLLGFSKSGWGSFSLLLRSPQFFGYACSWDAPLIMDGDDYGIWSTEKHWGTKENFLRYLPTKWAAENADKFRQQKRLVLLGHQLFGNRWACPEDSPHTATFHERLSRLDIRHVYDNTIEAPHSWNEKWLVPAIRRLVEIAGD